MDQFNPGWIGGILGGIIGLLGGAIGTYSSIKNTQGPKEKSFMVTCAVIVWAAIIFFLLLLFMLPAPYKYLLWIPYSIFLPIGIRYGNRKQQEIRKSEKKQNAAGKKIRPKRKLRPISFNFLLPESGRACSAAT